jgi:hypothetical protein
MSSAASLLQLFFRWGLLFVPAVWHLDSFTTSFDSEIIDMPHNSWLAFWGLATNLDSGDVCLQQKPVVFCFFFVGLPKG